MNTFLNASDMEYIPTDVIGNPSLLLFERLFWLGLGGFLSLAIMKSLLRGLKESKNNVDNFTQSELKNLAKKATKKNTQIK